MVMFTTQKQVLYTKNKTKQNKKTAVLEQNEKKKRKIIY